MEEPLSKRQKIKIAYMDGIISKEERDRQLEVEDFEEEQNGIEEEKIQSPKDEPNFYKE